MKIALFNCHARSVPPKKSGGIEKMMNYLIEGLIERSHQVTVFTTGDSYRRTGLEVVSIHETELEAQPFSSLKKNKLNEKWTKELGQKLIERQFEFDIICNFCLGAGLPVMADIKNVSISRISEALTFEAINRLMPYKDSKYVSLSYSQRVPFPQLNYYANIYNGIAVDSYPMPRKPEDFFVFVGRISKEKSPHLAILAAKQCSKKLYILGKYKDEHIESDYYENTFIPLLKENRHLVEWIGEVDQATVNDYFNRALASLHPVTFREPFGSAVIESMAAGCPPIVFAKGAYIETVENGKSGFLVEDVEEMAVRMGQISTINRSYCREYAKKHFDVSLMVDNYLRTFESCIIENQLAKPKIRSTKKLEVAII